VKAYSTTAFGHLTSPKQAISSELLDAELPTIEQVKTLATWSQQMLDLFDVTFEEATERNEHGGKDFDRSSALMRMAYYGAEMGWTDPQILTVLVDLDDRWMKYVGRRDREQKYLVPYINKARQKHGYSGSADDLSMLEFLKTQKTETGDPAKLVWDFDEFVNAEFHIDWLLEDLFAVGGFGLLVAHPGIGKTTLGIQMGAHLALGYDHFLRWKAVGGPKKVLFLSLEMGKPPLHHFLSTIKGNYDDPRALGRNFKVFPHGNALPLDGEAGQKFLGELLDQYLPDVLIIDSLQKISSKELTDEQAVKDLIHYLGVIRKKYNTSVLVIHHNRKKANDAQKKSVELSDVYGSTYITTDADFVMNLHKLDANQVEVTMLKSRLGPEPEPFAIRRTQHLSFESDLDDLYQRTSTKTQTTERTAPDVHDTRSAFGI
jgi:hypothetical protein